MCVSYEANLNNVTALNLKFNPRRPHFNLVHSPLLPKATFSCFVLLAQTKKIESGRDKKLSEILKTRSQHWNNQIRS
jgi:hypothetical protein